MIPLTLHPAHAIHCRIATTADLSFIEHLGRKFSNQLGFLPRTAVETYVANGRCIIGLFNDQHAGYVLGRESMRWDRRFANIVQTAVPMDLHRRHIGLALVEAYVASVSVTPRTNPHVVQCWCAEDIDANNFWPAANFRGVACRDPQNQRGRRLQLWRQPITRLGSEIMRNLPPVAGYRAMKIIRNMLDPDADPT